LYGEEKSTEPFLEAICGHYWRGCLVAADGQIRKSKALLAFSVIRMARNARKQEMRKRTRDKEEQSMINRYDPFREALSLRRAMDQLFDQSIVNPSQAPGTPLIAPMDVCETPNGYEVDVALPGVRPEDVEIVVDQNTLTIRGRYSYQNEHEKSAVGVQQQGQQQQWQSGQTQGQQQGQAGQMQGTATQQQGQQQQGRMERQSDRHRQGHNWLFREIPSGTFERTITFPRPLDVNNIQTRFENGVLTILLPVNEASRPKRISLTAGGQAQPQQIPVEAGQQRQQQR
jgi:HSP20 family protein